MYFGWVGQAGQSDTQMVTAPEREAGASSVPLHTLVDFRRVQLPYSSELDSAATSGSGFDPAVSAAPINVEFNVPLARLHLMKPNGTMGLLPGRWRVWVGGTSPRTPPALLRGSKESDGDGTRAAPQQLLETDWQVSPLPARGQPRFAPQRGTA